MNPALVLIALEEPGQSYQAEVPPTFTYIRCVGGETLSMKVQIPFQERGGDTRPYGEPKEALLIRVEGLGVRDENFSVCTQYCMITSD